MNLAGVVGHVLIVVGCGFFFAGTVGLLRFPDTHSRLHALTKADNTGLGFICLGLGFQDGSLSSVVKLLLVWLLSLVSAAVSAFLIAGWAATPQERAK